MEVRQMSSYNKVMLIGNIGREPEIKSLPSGVKVAEWSMATSKKWKDKSGEWKENTHWHRCKAFDKTAEAIERVSKGQRIHVEGSIEYRDWTDKDGNKRQTTEINVTHVVYLDRATGGASSGGGGSAPASSSPSSWDNDDVPF